MFTVPILFYAGIILNICRSRSKTTIEERVALLEIQVAVVEEEVTDLDLDVNFLFEEQIIPDERLFSLEQTSLGIIGELDLIEDVLEGGSVRLIF